MGMTKRYPLPEGRKWVQVGLERTRPNLNPHLPDMTVTAITAQRSDGVWFRVEGALFNEKIRLLLPKEAAIAALNMVGDLLNKLEGYRNCECEKDKPCTIHQQPRPN